MTIFCNGVFDLFHKGHMHLLDKAKELGDHIIVGINSNSSVKALKGDERPIDDENVRKRNVSLYLKDIPHTIHIFNEPTPDTILKDINFDIRVISSEYKDLVNKEKIVFLDRLDNYSTTKLINDTRKFHVLVTGIL